MTWKELKDFANALTGEQLDNKVILWREEEAISKIDAMQLEENHYVDMECPENGCFPESAADVPLSELTLVYKAGSPILNEDF